jgi:hypothetical protein
LTAKSVEIDSLKPPVKGKVRAKLIIAGWVLKQINDNTVKAIYCVQNDPMGKIPVINYISLINI